MDYRRLIAILMLLGGMARPLPLRASPPRVASLNLCTDQLVLSLADPADIAGISPLAADCRESPLCQKARRFRVLRPDGEDLLASGARLVLDGLWARPSVKTIAEALALTYVTLPPARKLQDVPEQFRQVARRLGRETQGEALAQEFRARLARLRPARPEKRLSAAVIGSGGGELMDALLDRAGFRPVTTGLEPGQINLERLIAHPPDLLIVLKLGDEMSLTEKIARHPLIRARFRGAHVLTLPARSQLCGTMETLDSLARLVAAHDRLTEGVRP